MRLNVLETYQFGDKLLVLYDWMEFPDSTSIRNLYAYDLEGEHLWIAEERRPGDFLTGFVRDSE